LGPWLDQNPDFIRHCARLVRVIDVNDASVIMHRARDGAELLSRLSSIFTPNSYHAFRRQIEAIWDGVFDLTLSTEIRTLEGDILDVILRWHVLPTHRDTHARIIVSCEDTTELRTAQRSVAITLEKLMQANAELERFTFGASHDLQEPVRSIISFSQLLERHLIAHGGVGTEAAEYLGFLKAAASRMQLQVAGLLDYARAGQSPSRFVSVALADALADARALEADDLAVNAAQLDIGPLPVVSGDRGQLAEIFRHLLDNALKFRHPERPPVISVSADRSGDVWRITVKDNGIGIDPLYAIGIFDVFRRLHGPAQFPGAGIGLSICRRIVERHGGEITVDTNCRDGATLSFTLPVAVPASPPTLASTVPAL
jgi:signal transduction histidine kinase